MAIGLMQDVWDRTDLRASEKLLLLALADSADQVHREAWPSIALLARRACVTIRWARQMLRDLERAGHIATVPRPGRSTVYRLLSVAERAEVEFPPEAGFPPEAEFPPGAEVEFPPPRKPSSARTVREPLVEPLGGAEPPPCPPKPIRTRSRKPKPAPRVPGWHTVPPGEELTEARRAYAMQVGLAGREVDDEWNLFVRHEFRDARHDVERTWQTWCLRARKFQRIVRGANGNGHARQPGPVYQDLEAVVAAQRREKGLA